VKLHLLLALMIFAGLVHSFVEAARLHLPTGATPQHAGAWLPDEADGPAETPPDADPLEVEAPASGQKLNGRLAAVR
jgi:hypothetical protein